MSEELIIRHGAPTLAGLKTGSVFQCPYQDAGMLLRELRQLNVQLSPKGLRILPLRFSQNRALLYLYRPGRLKRDLKQTDAACILRERGYCPENCSLCVAKLGKKLRQGGEFPHEIGLFLGYPPEDVRGFMDNGECKCTGCWKVYGDEAEARKTFALYKKCTRIYHDRWQKGRHLDRLTVQKNEE